MPVLVIVMLLNVVKSTISTTNDNLEIKEYYE